MGSPGSPPRSNCRAPETQVRRRKAARYMLTAGTARAPRVSERPGPVQRCYGVSCLVSRRVRYVYTMEYVRPRPRSAGPSAKARVCGAGPGAGWVPAPGGEPHDHSTTPPSPSAATKPPPQAMLDQYSWDLQAIPAFIKAIEPQRSPTHSPNSTVAAHVNQHLPQPTPTAQGTHRPPADLGESAQPPQPPQQPTPTEAPDRKWRLRQYPAHPHDGNN